MLESAPTVVINSAVDWPAVVAGISAGVAALAGIGATLWQASRTWGHEDKRAKIAEKRRIYAACLTTLSAGLRASVYRTFSAAPQKLPQLPMSTTSHRMRALTQ